METIALSYWEFISLIAVISTTLAVCRYVAEYAAVGIVFRRLGGRSADVVRNKKYSKGEITCLLGVTVALYITLLAAALWAIQTPVMSLVSFILKGRLL